METTKKVVYLLAQERSEHEAMLGAGVTYNQTSMEATALATARMVGIIEGMSKFLEMEVTDE